MKKILTFVFIFSAFFNFNLIAQNANSSTVKFIKGNISDKTAAVREASESEVAWISTQAIDFCLQNKEVLGADRELDGLAVAAILSISPELIKNDEASYNKLLSDFTSLFIKFNKSNTVQIAVISKIVALKDTIPSDAFTTVINEYIRSTDIKAIDSGVFKACVSALETIGNNESFSILYGLLNDARYNSYRKEIEATTVALIPTAMDEVLGMISNSDIKKITSIFELTQKNSKISAKNLCEISEKVLIETILLTENSSGISEADADVQLSALKVLSDNKWTRASDTVLNFFGLSKKMYEKSTLKEDKFITVISSLRNIAPLNAVSPLISYLEELNNLTESGKKVSSDLVMAIIDTLGAIGDKAAFDSLLVVTGLENYEESVRAAAQKALLGLRWQ